MNYMKSINYSYTQKECVVLCRNLLANETSNCNCFINNLNEKYLIKCHDNNNDSKLIKCTEDFYATFNIEKCAMYCPLECDSFYYDIRLNTKLILTNGQITDDIYGFKTYENMSKTFFGIYVYYEDLKYTLIEQNPRIELFGLISNVGGTLGLFLGFSFISILEIFEMFVEASFY
jgi:hypothetical protein